MQTKEQTSKEYFRTISIIHAALIIGQILFIGVILFNNPSGATTTEVSIFGETTVIIALTLAAAGILGGIFISKNRLESIDERSELKDKLAQYTSTQIVKFALLEGPSLFALVNFLISGNYVFLGIAVIMILILLLNSPTKEKAMSDLQLSHKERMMIEDPNAIVGEVKIGG